MLNDVLGYHGRHFLFIGAETRDGDNKLLTILRAESNNLFVIQ